MSTKLYKFLYDRQTGVYLGITRDLLLSNTTDVEPFFDPEFRTVWDFKVKAWGLIPREDYYQLMAIGSQIVERESILMPVLNTLEHSIERNNFDTAKMYRISNDQHERIIRSVSHLNTWLSESVTPIKQISYETNSELLKVFAKIVVIESKLNTIFEVISFIKFESRPWYIKLFQFFGLSK